MGFFKDLKNKITGGAATVRLSVPSAQRGKPVQVQVQITAKAAGKVSAVYLLVRGTESCEWKENNEKVGQSKGSFETRVQIAGAMDLVEGQSYDLQGMFELPGNVQPTFRGALINHTWEVQAGLDMPGNDPDSGWVAFEVQ
jgi:hypothetical protein